MDAQFAMKPIGTVHSEIREPVDGMPVLDIKPYMPEFGPKGAVREPKWASELMDAYWDAPK